MFTTYTIEIEKWNLIITFVTRDTKVVWLLLLIADRLLFHFGKLEQECRGHTAWKRQMESVCDDFGKWMNGVVVEVCIREKKKSVSRCWMYAKDLTG
jgi:hypothetical protein